MVEKGQEPVAGAQVTKPATGRYVNLHKFILLQTAACIVSSTHSAKTGIKLHIIFDQGSQHKYLSQRARDALNLNTVTKERLQRKKNLKYVIKWKLLLAVFSIHLK